MTWPIKLCTSFLKLKWKLKEPDLFSKNSNRITWWTNDNLASWGKSTRLGPKDLGMLDVENSSWDQGRVNLGGDVIADHELLQLEGDTIPDELQEGLHHACGGIFSDVDPRNKRDHPGLEKILRLLRMLIEIHIELGPAPELSIGENSLTPLPAEIYVNI